MSTTTMSPHEWLFGGDTGLSSECMWRTFMGVREPADWFRRGSYPLDPADLGRCIRLLDRFPEWRPRLSEMRVHGPAWSALVDHWDELEALYREEAPSGMAPRCYARMVEIISPIRYARATPTDRSERDE